MKRNTWLVIGSVIVLIILTYHAKLGLFSIGSQPQTGLVINDKVDAGLIDAVSKPQGLFSVAAKDKSFDTIILVKDQKELDVKQQANIKKSSDFKTINAIATSLTIDQINNLSVNEDVNKIYLDENFKTFSTIDDSLLMHNSLPKTELGSGINVCILDTGISNDFNGNVVKKTTILNKEETDGVAEDDSGHGTLVAEIVSSMASESNIFIGKVCKEGNCVSSDVMMGIEWCKENQADVISLSLGSVCYKNPYYMCDAYPISRLINQVTEQDGILFPMASGNILDDTCSDFKIALPACASKGIAVASIDEINLEEVINPASWDLVFKSLGSEDSRGVELIDITANGRIGNEIGTSVSAPHVTGAIAVIKSITKEDSETVRQLLYDSSTKQDSNGNVYAGHGLLNVKGACTLDNINCENLFLSNPEPVTQPTQNSQDYSLLAFGVLAILLYFFIREKK